MAVELVALMIRRRWRLFFGHLKTERQLDFYTCALLPTAAAGGRDGGVGCVNTRTVDLRCIIVRVEELEWTLMMRVRVFSVFVDVDLRSFTKRTERRSATRNVRRCLGVELLFIVAFGADDAVTSVDLFCCLIGVGGGAFGSPDVAQIDSDESLRFAFSFFA